MTELINPTTESIKEGEGEELISREDMQEMVKATMQHLEEGKMVTGKIYGIRSEYVVVDIGYKSKA